MASPLCQIDQERVSDLCCVCAFPLPSLCAECSETHRSSPGFHYFYPLAVREEIKSHTALHRVQRKLSTLILTYNESQRVLIAFQRAVESIHAAYQEAVHALTIICNTHISQLQGAAQAYQTQVEEAISVSYNDAYTSSDFQHTDPFLRFIWTYEPGGNTEFDLHYQVKPDLEPLAQLLTVKWALLLPGLCRSSETTFPLRIVLETGQVEVLLMQQTQTLSDVRSELEAKGADVRDHKRFRDESGELQDDWQLANCGLVSGSRLYFTSMWVIRLINSDWKDYGVIVDPNSPLKDLIASLPADSQPLPVRKYLISNHQWLDESMSLVECGLTSGCTLQVVIRVRRDSIRSFTI